jgi:DNA-binding response OmpR family regulator
MGKRILSIDDEQEILDCINFILHMEGYVVGTSLSPENIFFQIRQFQPDLILLDINMGAYNGLEVCQAIHSNPDTENIPIIIVSSDDRIHSAIKHFCASDIISKPFNLDTLLSVVNKHLDAKIIPINRYKEG